jgi:hypothetical protein
LPIKQEKGENDNLNRLNGKKKPKFCWGHSGAFWREKKQGRAKYPEFNSPPSLKIFLKKMRAPSANCQPLNTMSAYYFGQFNVVLAALAACKRCTCLIFCGGKHNGSKEEKNDKEDRKEEKKEEIIVRRMPAIS